MEKKSTTAIVKKEEGKSKPTAEKKGKVEAEKGMVGEAKVVEVQPKVEEQEPEQGTPKQEVPKSLNMVYLYSEIQAVKQIIQEHGQQIGDIQEVLIRKRKPISNSKVQIKDKKSGKVYPSKNATYQSLLKAGELKELVDKGIFGDDPKKNTFGWYALVREWPARFEEVKSEQSKEQA